MPRLRTQSFECEYAEALYAFLALDKLPAILPGAKGFLCSAQIQRWTGDVSMLAALYRETREQYDDHHMSKMWATPVLIAVFAHFSCAPRERLTFEAKVADLGRPTNSLAVNKRPDDFVEITVPGRLLPVPSPMNLVGRNEADWSTPDHAIASIVSANIAGDVPWIIENFQIAERDDARKRFTDPAVARRIQDYYRNAGKIETMGWAEVRGFTVVFLRGLDEDGDSTFMTETLAKTPIGWRQTQALSQDDTYDVVWTALHAGRVR